VVTGSFDDSSSSLEKPTSFLPEGGVGSTDRLLGDARREDDLGDNDFLDGTLLLLKAISSLDSLFRNLRIYRFLVVAVIGPQEIPFSFNFARNSRSEISSLTAAILSLAVDSRLTRFPDGSLSDPS
jgi:hypothetical protein